jgi:hypothetical protein
MNARTLSLSLAVAAACTFGVARAGDMTPPGAPGPTMKTLDEVEARIPVGPLTTPGDSVSVYQITQPGSYYLTGDVIGQAGKAGIEIACADVYLDLNGYAVRGVAGATIGINVPGWVAGGAIRNGLVTDWPGSGVFFRIDCGLISDLYIRGCGDWGIDASGTYAPRIQRVAAIYCGIPDGRGGGIQISDGMVLDSVVHSCNGAGIEAPGATVSRCQVGNIAVDSTATQLGDGIKALIVESSSASFSAGTGVIGNRLIRGCVSRNNLVADYWGPNIVDSF